MSQAINQTVYTYSFAIAQHSDGLDVEFNLSGTDSFGDPQALALFDQILAAFNTAGVIGNIGGSESSVQKLVQNDMQYSADSTQNPPAFS